MKKIGAQKGAATLALASLVAGSFGMLTKDAGAVESTPGKFLGSGAEVRSNLLSSVAAAAATATPSPSPSPSPDGKAGGEGKCGEGKCGGGKK